MNIRKIDLNLLNILDVLLEVGSVSGAARHIGLSQPAVSHALNRLRTLLGDPLFVRVGRRLEPTSRATELREPLRKYLEELDKILFQKSSFDPLVATDKFVISADDLIGGTVVADVMRLCSKEAPNLQFIVRPWLEDDAVQLLSQGDIDFALRVDAPNRSGIYGKKLFDENFCCLLDKNHPYATKNLTLKRFLESPHLLVSLRGDAKGIIDQELEKIGLHRFIRGVVPNFTSIPWAIMDSDCIATVPKLVANRLAKNLPLVKKQVPLQLPSSSIFLLWHDRKHRNPANHWLREKFYQVEPPS